MLASVKKDRFEAVVACEMEHLIDRGPGRLRGRGCLVGGLSKKYGAQGDQALVRPMVGLALECRVHFGEGDTDITEIDRAPRPTKDSGYAVLQETLQPCADGGASSVGSVGDLAECSAGEKGLHRTEAGEVFLSVCTPELGGKGSLERCLRGRRHGRWSVNFDHAAAGQERGKSAFAEEGEPMGDIGRSGAGAPGGLSVGRAGSDGADGRQPLSYPGVALGTKGLIELGAGAMKFRWFVARHFEGKVYDGVAWRGRT